MSPDENRYAFLKWLLSGCKWADVLPTLKPEDEKYITANSLDDAIDNAIKELRP